MTNSTKFSPKQVMKLYCRRMQVEQDFRNEKILIRRFGLYFVGGHSSE
ncbi:transposase [Enterobacter mori]